MSKPILTGLPQAAKDRFWAKVDKRGPEECWQWTAAKDRYGRGLFWVPGTNTYYFAPRIALMEKTGEFPSSDVFACHTCDKPSCVNPSHLWWGSRSENMKDCGSKGRHGYQTKRIGSKNQNAKLTEDEVRDIRKRYDCGERSRDIANIYGITAGNVWRIGKRKSWAHLDIIRRTSHDD